MQHILNPVCHPIDASAPVLTSGSRVFAISDIHTDIKVNWEWLHALSSTTYTQDTLILAGDISGNLQVLQDTLSHLISIFAQVCFVPGNHDLWVRKREYRNSIAKFHNIQQLCDLIGVHTRPVRVGSLHLRHSVWVVPLFSWYVKPEEGPSSLFQAKLGDDPTLSMWSDTHFTHWPELESHQTIADYFLQLNERHLTRSYDAPIISFSHFLPRSELIYSTQEERRGAGITTMRDPHPTFNFSRVAGSTGIDDQIRRLGATIHIYGHQHRNRNRVIDGVQYISHCLGYPRERHHQNLQNQIHSPLLIWNGRNEGC